jgi:hypothetical protein
MGRKRDKGRYFMSHFRNREKRGQVWRENDATSEKNNFCGHFHDLWWAMVGLVGPTKKRSRMEGKWGMGRQQKSANQRHKTTDDHQDHLFPEANNHRSELDEQPLSIDFANPSPTTDYSPRSKIPITTHQAELLQRSFAATIFVC